MDYILILILSSIGSLVGGFIKKGRISTTLIILGVCGTIYLGLFGYLDSNNLHKQLKTTQENAQENSTAQESKIEGLQYEVAYPDDHALYQFGKIIAHFQNGEPPIIETSTITFPVLYDVTKITSTTSTIMILNGKIIYLKLLSYGNIGGFLITGNTGGANMAQNVIFKKIQ